MKIPDFRKYVFSYITIALAIGFYCLLIEFHNAHFPPENPDDLIGPASAAFMVIGYQFLFYLYSCAFLILEILIRKFIINRFFPNLKFPIKLDVPKTIIRIYNVVFNILFIMALLPVTFVILALIIGVIFL